MLERSNVEHPLWRKKVDLSLLDKGVTPIPKWVCKIWGVESSFQSSSQNDESSKISVRFLDDDNANTIYQASIVRAAKGQFKLFLSLAALGLLKRKYPMSYMRILEYKLCRNTMTSRQLEKDTKFWEFVDLEYDSRNKILLVASPYTMEPMFPKLFSELIDAPALQSLEDRIADKSRIRKSAWLDRARLESQIGARNVIYTLADTTNQLIYIGKATDLVARLQQEHPTIPTWDKFRYEIPPSLYETELEEVEQMAIGLIASLLDNGSDFSSLGMLEFRLVNRKIFPHSQGK
jgi:hypothetical protein